MLAMLSWTAQDLDFKLAISFITELSVILSGLMLKLKLEETMQDCKV